MFRPPHGLLLGAVLSAPLAVGCASNQEPARSPSTMDEGLPFCRDSLSDDVELAARTGWAGTKTGVKTGVEGVKTGGRAVGGFVEGGSRGAEQEWNAGKADTRRVANQSAAEVRREASVPVCPPD